MQDEAKTQFERLQEAVRYFARHPKEAMRFNGSWASLTSRLSVISKTAHETCEDANALAEWKASHCPRKKHLVNHADYDFNWHKSILSTPDHAARCCLCGQPQYQCWQYRLYGTRIYSCDACMKRKDKRDAVMQYCRVHPEALPAAVYEAEPGGAPS